MSFQEDREKPITNLVTNSVNKEVSNQLLFCTWEVFCYNGSVILFKNACRISVINVQLLILRGDASWISNCWGGGALTKDFCPVGFASSFCSDACAWILNGWFATYLTSDLQQLALEKEQVITSRLLKVICVVYGHVYHNWLVFSRLLHMWRQVLCPTHPPLKGGKEKKASCQSKWEERSFPPHTLEPHLIRCLSPETRSAFLLSSAIFCLLELLWKNHSQPVSFPSGIQEINPWKLQLVVEKRSGELVILSITSNINGHVYLKH